MAASRFWPHHPIVMNARAATLLDAKSHPKFVNKLSVPRELGLRIDKTQNTSTLQVDIVGFEQDLGLVNNGTRLTTQVYGYQFAGLPATYPGATIVAKKDNPIRVNWQNRLPTGRGGLQATHLLENTVDLSIHMAMPYKDLPQGSIPIVTHLHGGHTDSGSDGLPDAWYTQNSAQKGPKWQNGNYRYDNDQEAGTLWYHDHALGITRLNVYAGLAGFFLLRDDNELNLIADGKIPGGQYEIEMAIQDRQFTDDGQLFFPAMPEPSDFLECQQSQDPNMPNPSILPEFFGDFILVNGMAWPYLEVEPTRYRFRVLNGSDSRFYQFRFDNGMTFYQIGVDGGFLVRPIAIGPGELVDALTLAPGERADIVVDFSSAAGQSIILKNIGPDGPFKSFEQGGADPDTTGLIMQFRVKPQGGNSAPAFSPNLSLRSAQFNVPGTAQTTRQLVLFEGRDGFGRLRPQLGTLAEGSLMWEDPITERPGLDDIEIWEIYNTTEDAHPIHLHLVSFEVLNRQNFTGEVVCHGMEMMEDGTMLQLMDPVLQGFPAKPLINEQGPKDTVIMLPGQVTRIKAKFDRPGEYVWHCHILSHEDHEMMRPYEIV